MTPPLSQVPEAESQQADTVGLGWRSSTGGFTKPSKTTDPVRLIVSLKDRSSSDWRKIDIPVGTPFWKFAWDEDWDGELWLVTVTNTLYRIRNKWVLKTKRYDRRTDSILEKDAEVLSDEEAVDLLLKHGGDIPADIAHLAESRDFFAHASAASQDTLAPLTGVDAYQKAAPPADEAVRDAGDALTGNQPNDSPTPDQVVQWPLVEAPAEIDDDPLDEPIPNSIRLVAEVWHIHFGEEEGEFPKKGNQAIGWLAQLLLAPNRFLSVANLRGDAEDKQTADALLHVERETDKQGIFAIKKRITEIDDITDQTGGSETLETEKAKLLRGLKRANEEKVLTNPLRKIHHSMATQIRNLRRPKLAKAMPKLAAHLKASLKLTIPDFGYFPPPGTFAWKN